MTERQGCIGNNSCLNLIRVIRPCWQNLTREPEIDGRPVDNGHTFERGEIERLDHEAFEYYSDL